MHMWVLLFQPLLHYAVGPTTQQNLQESSEETRGAWMTDSQLALEPGWDEW